MLPGPYEGVNAAAGFSLPIEIDWPNVVVEPLIGHGGKFTEPELFTDVSFRPLIAALRAIGCNQISRDALKDGLTRSHPAHRWPCVRPLVAPTSPGLSSPTAFRRAARSATRSGSRAGW